MGPGRDSKTGAVVLAAGLGRRAGGPKVVWPVGGLPSVRRVALAALGASRVDRTAVVTGRWKTEVEEALAGLPGLTLIHNPRFNEGQALSLRTGLAALGPEVRYGLVLLGDQPFITSQILDDLVKFIQESRATLAAPVLEGRRVNPVVFDLRRWGRALAELEGDAGGRSILAAHPEELAGWPADPALAACFRDFDSREELEELLLLTDQERPTGA